MSDRFDHTLERKLDTKPDGADDEPRGVRRSELITGTGRRRQWSTADRSRILLESLELGANVSEVARRNGLSPQQLFGWRRQVRCDPAAGRSGAPSKNVREPIGESSGEPVGKHLVRDHTAPAPSPVRKRGRPKQDRGERRPCGDTPTFAAVVIAAPAGPPLPPATTSPPDLAQRGAIEITIGDAVVRVSGQVDASLIAVVLRAVRRAT